MRARLIGAAAALAMVSAALQPPVAAADWGVVWSDRYIRADYGEARGVAIGADGSVYVTGSTTRFVPSAGGISLALPELFVARYSAAGVLLWRTTFAKDDMASSSGRDIAVSPDGSAFVAGWGEIKDVGMAVLTLKLSAEGVAVWERYGRVRQGGWSGGEAIALDVDGGVFVAAVDQDLSVWGTVILKYSSDGTPDGEIIHGTGYTGGSLGQPTDLAPGPDGSLLLGGRVGSTSFVASYLPVGAKAWESVLPGSGNVSVVALGDGSLRVAVGESLVSMSAGGAFLASVPGVSGAEGIAADAHDNVYLTGHQGVTASFDAAGTLRWTHTFGYDTQDGGLDVAASRGGSLVAMAGTLFVLPGPDALVVAYGPLPAALCRPSELYNEAFADRVGFDKYWFVPSGRWIADGGALTPEGNGRSMAVVTNPFLDGFRDGSVAARLRLPYAAGPGASAAILFGWMDAERYRHLTVRPGRILIGEREGVDNHVKEERSLEIPPGDWVSLRLTISADGLVRVFAGGQLVLTADFPPRTGRVGFLTLGTRAQFDDLLVRGD